MYEKFKKDSWAKECIAKYSRAEWLVNNLKGDADYNEAKRLIEECGNYQPCVDLLPVLEEKYAKYKKEEAERRAAKEKISRSIERAAKIKMICTISIIAIIVLIILIYFMNFVMLLIN